MPSVSTASESVMIERTCPAVRDRLLNVALQLFAEKGYEATSVSEIALAAEVTKPTLYYYFKSKEGLYLELANYLYETIENAVLVSTAHGETARSKIKSFILKILNYISKNNDNRKFVLIIIKSNRQDIITKLHSIIVDLINSKLCEFIINGINSDELLIDDIENVVR